MTELVTYSKDQHEIVKAGIDAIRTVLKGDNAAEKRSLMLCLDWYMDPYYCHRHEIMPFHEELKELLQEVILEDTDKDVITDAVQLLQDYEFPPFPLLEENFHSIPEPFCHDVDILLHPQPAREYRDIRDLYHDLKNTEGLQGTVTLENSTVFWQLPNGILIEIRISRPENSSLCEGYIGTSCMKDGKKQILAHWHPVPEDIWSDLMDIHTGRIIWAVKKTLFGETPPLLFDIREFSRLPQKEKDKYTILQEMNCNAGS